MVAAQPERPASGPGLEQDGQSNGAQRGRHRDLHRHAQQTGPDPATGVQVSDPSPSGLQLVSATPSQGTYDPATGLWSVGAVSTHAAPTLTITAKVISPTAETNSAAITHSDQFDPDPANNRAARP